LEKKRPAILIHLSLLLVESAIDCEIPAAMPTRA
jgi:hypothetical protein